MYKPTQAYLDQSKARQSKGDGNKKATHVDVNAVDQKTGLKLPILFQSKAKGEACFCCGSPDHKLNKCKLKDKIPKNDWAINKFNGMKNSFMPQYNQWILNRDKPNTTAPNLAQQQSPTKGQLTECR